MVSIDDTAESIYDNMVIITVVVASLQFFQVAVRVLGAESRMAITSSIGP